MWFCIVSDRQLTGGVNVRVRNFNIFLGSFSFRYLDFFFIGERELKMLVEVSFFYVFGGRKWLKMIIVEILFGKRFFLEYVVVVVNIYEFFYSF